jgi:hypothetical protein
MYNNQALKYGGIKRRCAGTVKSPVMEALFMDVFVGNNKQKSFMVWAEVVDRTWLARRKGPVDEMATGAAELHFNFD